mmetsp:Transcript_77946/g.215479  ORF Transcript_77946/g.215479 Transcript_77946/m.215479 type:complete len:639 (+) Transcript_77946:74-1990(+)
MSLLAALRCLELLALVTPAALAARARLPDVSAPAKAPRAGPPGASARLAAAPGRSPPQDPALLQRRDVAGDEEGPWAKGMGSKVNYFRTVSAMQTTVKGITQFTGKVKVETKSKKVIDGTAQVAQGLGTLMMAIAPGMGPALPFVFAGGALISCLAGTAMAIFEEKKEPGAGPPPEVGFAGLSGQLGQGFKHLAEHIQEGFKSVGLQLDELGVRTKMLQGSMDSALSKLDQVLETLDKIRKMQMEAHLKMDWQAIKVIRGQYTDWLELVSEGAEPTEIYEALQPQTQANAERLANMRAAFVDNMKSLAACEPCGGKAAAALWFHNALPARFQYFIILYTVRLYEQKLTLVSFLLRHLNEDLQEFMKAVKDLGLQPWLRLTGAELTPYVQVSPGTLRQVRELSQHLESGDPALQAAAARNLSKIGAPGAAGAAAPLRRLLRTRTQVVLARSPSECLTSGGKGGGLSAEACADRADQWFSFADGLLMTEDDLCPVRENRDVVLRSCGQPPWTPHLNWRLRLEQCTPQACPGRFYCAMTKGFSGAPTKVRDEVRLEAVPGSSQPGAKAVRFGEHGYGDLSMWVALQVEPCKAAAEALASIGFPGAGGAESELGRIARHHEKDPFADCAEAAQQALRVLQRE